MSAEDVGFEGNQMVIGKHSGQHAIKQWLEQHQIEMTAVEIASLTKSVKQIADKNKRVNDQDIYDCIKQNGLQTTDSSQTMMAQNDMVDLFEFDPVGYMRNARW